MIRTTRLSLFSGLDEIELVINLYGGAVWDKVYISGQIAMLILLYSFDYELLN